MITLPFPPASLSGHNNGHWRTKQALVKEYRAKALEAAEKAKPSVPGLGDIPVHIRFVPPDRRSDRVNFANRMKPYFDGIADALGVNDVRFLPTYEFAEPEKPGRVEVFINTPSIPGVQLNAFRPESCAVTGPSPQAQEAAE